MNRNAFLTSGTAMRHSMLFVLLTTFGNIAHAQQVTTTNYQYDANGNLTQITDPLSNVTNQTYDKLNRLTQQTQPVPATGVARPVINYTYDGQDQLATIVDPRSKTTTYTVDGIGNQTALASPDTGTANRTYDAAGNLATSTDARGKTTTYTYDASNRVTQISYPTGVATTFTYDSDSTSGTHPQGHLVMITDESGSTHYLYDGFGRVSSKIQTVIAGSTSYTMGYQYGSSGSDNGLLTAITYPSGSRINYTHDSAGRISGITFNPVNASGSGTNTSVTVNLLTGIGYTPTGIPNAWTWGNDTPTAHNTYARSTDLDGRLASYPLGNSLNNGTVRTVGYDAASRITATTHTGSGTGSNAPANFNQSFGYDGLDRTTSFTGNSTSQGYGYDATGNRTSFSIGASNYANTISSTSNRLSSTTGPSPAKTDTYDNAGNLTSDGTITYSYSDRGRMKSATAAGVTTNYLYNGLNQRVSKASSAITTGGNQYVYDEAGHLIGEYDATGKVIEETVYLGNTPVAVLTQTITGTAPNTTTTVNVYYVYADHLNAPRVITRATDNQMVWRWDNADPFGMGSPDSNPNGLGTFTYNQRFPGQLYDQETNINYNYFRYYDSQTGRYITSDPIGLAGGINTYGYVSGNPIIFTDSLGLAGGIDPVLKGQAGVSQALQQLYPQSTAGNSATNVGQEITLEVPGKARVRLDIGSYDPYTKILELTEVKNGPNARLTENQHACFPDVENGNIIPRGKNAANLGLEVGKLGGGIKKVLLRIMNLGGANVSTPSATPIEPISDVVVEPAIKVEIPPVLEIP